jgi:hypothetical protein
LADKKIYLDQAGLERLVDYIKNELSQKADKGELIDLPEDLVYEADLDDYAKKSEVVAQLPADLVYDADIVDVVREAALDDLATKDELSAVEAKASAAYHVKGSVADLAALQAIESPEQGDVYNLEDTGINAVWTGSEWDELGTFVDLTPYLPKEDVYPISDEILNALLYSGPRAIVSDKASLVAMLENDEPEVEIILNGNIALSEDILVAADKKVVLDLDGNKMTIPSGKELKVNGELVIDGDGEIEAAKWGVNAYGADAKVTLNSGKLVATESPMSIQGGASFEMNGGELEGIDNCPLMGQGTAGNGGTEMIMNGGKLIAHITSAGYIACGVYMPNNGKFIMNGGEIISDGAGVVMRAGEVELNGGSIVANGESGVKGKVGDSRVVVGPYAVVYDELAKYPGASAGEFKLTIGADMELQGTDGDIETLLSSGATANIIDNRA